MSDKAVGQMAEYKLHNGRRARMPEHMFRYYPSYRRFLEDKRGHARTLTSVVREACRGSAFLPREARQALWDARDALKRFREMMKQSEAGR
jgi:galactokinase